MEYHSCPSQGSKINTSSAARAHCRPLVVGMKSPSKVAVGVGGVWRTEAESDEGTRSLPNRVPGACGIRKAGRPTHFTLSYRCSWGLNTSFSQRRAQCLQSPVTNALTSIPSEPSNSTKKFFRKVLSSEGLPGLCSRRTLPLENQSWSTNPFPSGQTNLGVTPRPVDISAPTKMHVNTTRPRCSTHPSTPYPTHHMAQRLAN